MKKIITGIILLCLLLCSNAIYAEDFALTAVSYDGVYDGLSHEGGAVASAEGAVISYSIDGGQTWSKVKPVITEAGTVNYQVKAELAGSETQFSEGRLTIKPLDVTVTIIGKQGITPFDEAEHGVEGYDAFFSSDLYHKEDFEFSGIASAARTEVGTTYMELSPARFVNNNPNFNVTFNVTDGYQRITAKNEVVVTIVGHHSTAIFNGHDHSVNGYDIVSISNELYREDYFEFLGRADARRTDVGISYMGLKADDFVNRNGKFSEVIFYVTDGYQEIISPFESSVDARINHVNNVDGNRQTPQDLESENLTLMAVIYNNTEEYYSEALSVDTKLLVMSAPLMLKFRFKDSLPDLYSGRYSVEMMGIPEEMHGTGRVNGSDPSLKHKYLITVDDAWINSSGQIEITLIWEEDYASYKDGDPSARSLPEDEIGAYSINENGEKEYVVFQTYAICMSYLGDDELCSSGGRTFRK